MATGAPLVIGESIHGRIRVGGFYGSVQIRGKDRDAVHSVLADFSRNTGRRFLVGPPLNGWIGIYPDDSGQELDLARDLARRLPGEVFAVRVHDDDAFAYEYYRDGEPIDAYDSCLVDVDEVSEEKSLALRWRPEAFAHLVSDLAKLRAMKERLAAQSSGRDVLATELLEAFADTLGIQNAVTSYDYLLENGETADIEGWDQFVGVPDPDQRRRLTFTRMLLAERGNPGSGATPAPACAPQPMAKAFSSCGAFRSDPSRSSGPSERMDRHGRAVRR